MDPRSEDEVAELSCHGLGAAARQIRYYQVKFLRVNRDLRDSSCLGAAGFDCSLEYVHSIPL